MFGWRHYVPALKAKAAEFRALQRLQPNSKALMTPLWEMVPAGDPHDLAFPNLVRQLSRAWQDPNDIRRPSFIDPRDAEYDRGFLAALFRHARAANCPLIPVVAIGSPGAYRAEVRTETARDGRGVCIRVERAETRDANWLRTELDRLLQDVGGARRTTDLIIDLAAVQGLDADEVHRRAAQALGSIPAFTSWRSTTLLSGAFPQSLELGVHTFDRLDWLAWLARREAAGSGRAPTYGDYAVQGPRRGLGPAFGGAPNLRYCREEDWICYRGRGRARGRPGQPVNAQFHQLCRQLRDTATMTMESWADDYIIDCADETDGPGGPETWRRVGFNRHITVVTNRIAALP